MEEKKISEGSKWLSRTFYLALIWTAYVGFGLVLLALGHDIPIGTLIGSGSLVTAAYIGGEKFIDSKKFPRNG